MLILAAGVDRSVHGVVGIHRPTFGPEYFSGLSQEKASAKYASVAEQVRTYLSRMGMSARLFEEMMKVGSYDIKVLTPGEIVDLNLSGCDPAYEERQRAEDGVKYRAEYMKRRDAYYARMRRYGERCMQSGKTQFDCMMEYQHIESPPRIPESPARKTSPPEMPVDYGAYGIPVR